MLLSICQQIWKTQQWPQDRKRSVFIPIPKKGNAKECSNHCTIALISHASKLVLKILKPGFNSMWTMKFQMFKLDVEKAKEPEIKLPASIQFSQFNQFSHSVMSGSLQPQESQHASLPCPSPTPGAYPNPCPLSHWCHPLISSSVLPFSSCPQSFPALGSFPMSQLFTWGGQSIGVSASTSVLPINTQDWSPLGRTGWISSQSKGLSAVFSNTTVQKHQFFGAQLSSPSNSHIHTWLLEKP